MKLVVRAVTALALLGVASPALPCPGMQHTTTAEAQPAKPAADAKAKDKLAKSEKAKASKQKGTQEQKGATAAN